jgi:hypothetical protein
VLKGPYAAAYRRVCQPMSDEARVPSSDELDNLCRLMALEFLMMDTLALRYLASSEPLSAASAHREHLREVLREISLPPVVGVDWELVIGKIGDAVNLLVRQAGQSAARRAEERRQP